MRTANSSYNSLDNNEVLFKKGTDVFGNKSNFLTWVHSKNIALGGVKPINLLDNSFGISKDTSFPGRKWQDCQTA